MTKTPSSTPSLKQLALDAIGAIAAQLRAADPSLSQAQSVAKAAQTPEGRNAYDVYRMPGAGEPWPVVVAHMAKGEGFLEQASMRDIIIAKRALSKEGGSGGSGPRGTLIEDPKTRGPKAPADTLPAKPQRPTVTAPISPADAIYAGIRAAALRAAPAGTSDATAIAAYLNTSAGQAAHRAWNAAMQAQ